jgi:hypothetical protein
MRKFLLGFLVGIRKGSGERRVASGEWEEMKIEER